MSKEQLLKIGFSKTPFKITQLKLTMGSDVHYDRKKLKIVINYGIREMVVNLAPRQNLWDEGLNVNSGSNQFVLDSSLIHHKLDIVSLISLRTLRYK